MTAPFRSMALNSFVGAELTANIQCPAGVLKYNENEAIRMGAAREIKIIGVSDQSRG